MLHSNKCEIMKFEIISSSYLKKWIWQVRQSIYLSTRSIIIPVNVDILATHQRLSIESTRRKYDDDRDILGQRSRKATLAQGATGHGRTPESLSSPLFTFIFPFPFFFLSFAQVSIAFPFAISKGTFLIKRHNLQLSINA